MTSSVSRAETKTDLLMLARRRFLAGGLGLIAIVPVAAFLLAAGHNPKWIFPAVAFTASAWTVVHEWLAEHRGHQRAFRVAFVTSRLPSIGAIGDVLLGALLILLVGCLPAWASNLGLPRVGGDIYPRPAKLAPSEGPRKRIEPSGGGADLEPNRTLQRKCFVDSSWEACLALGKLWEQSKPDEAVRPYRHACDRGQVRACVRLAQHAAANPGLLLKSEILHLNRRSCELGNDHGCDLLAQSLTQDVPELARHGEVSGLQVREIVALLSTACEARRRAAACNAVGTELQRDDELGRALGFFERACTLEQGELESGRKIFPHGCVEAATLMTRPKVVPVPDVNLVMERYRLGCDRAIARACQRAAELHEKEWRGLDKLAAVPYRQRACSLNAAFCTPAK